MPAALAPSAIYPVIRAHRIALGLSQEAFADQIGMHRTQYGAIEQGRKDCRLSTLLRIAHALDVDLWELLQKADHAVLHRRPRGHG
ncbi:helix-turn-helix transcriptional regulator [Pseudoxanthomonas sp. SL93]|uniref:helix-turn-helix domain-containing protein n=1 Tax=Pseudoxanthomonas sp. SL93 TaxID=2995142 RepID=UPI00226F1F02|nr:helix-turn-helix transcriptional regulator [Pseudoxanthomonas sp. SL93]WAC64024.1 helix-turn-helix transcriptional regulator [Pseudoxanthomonas sp. SL93]